MPQGTVKHFNRDRGFGFIKSDDGRRDIFFHINRVRNDVEGVPVGTRVEFEEATNREGLPQAVDVQLVAVQFGD
jgi:CspA family cold shock protein